ncbi:MAG TPA: ANTAR domain-containing protein, partial [Microlunatus sp.]|nr:ANTAR domain-containing protein [Microlunatus sp.]
DLAAVYTRLVTGAVRRNHARVHLQRAVTARHRVGQAQGIVMARLELTAADAFELLIRRSQNTNVKLSIITDQIIHSQEMHSQGLEAHPGADPRGEVAGVPGPRSGDEAGSLIEQLARTTIRSLRAVDDPTDHRVVASELLDALSEAMVMGPGDAAGRAEVMCAVVEEMRASLEWLNDADTREELRSLQPAVAATHEHLRRMLRLTSTETS